MTARPQPISHGSLILRSLAIAAVLALTFVIGHYGLRPAIVAPEHAAGSEMGQSLENVPAPPRARLVGAVRSEPGSGRVMVRYISAAPSNVVVDFYKREMPARGWVERHLARPETGGEILAFADPHGILCIIDVSEASGEAGGTAITLLRMAPPSGPASAPADARQEKN